MRKNIFKSQSIPVSGGFSVGFSEVDDGDVGTK